VGEFCCCAPRCSLTPRARSPRIKVLFAGSPHHDPPAGKAARRTPLGRAARAPAPRAEPGAFAPAECELACAGVAAVDTGQVLVNLREASQPALPAPPRGS